jgi:hypothetical protein
MRSAIRTARQGGRGLDSGHTWVGLGPNDNQFQGAARLGERVVKKKLSQTNIHSSTAKQRTTTTTKQERKPRDNFYFILFWICIYIPQHVSMTKTRVINKIGVKWDI